MLVYWIMYYDHVLEFYYHINAALNVAMVLR